MIIDNINIISSNSDGNMTIVNNDLVIDAGILYKLPKPSMIKAIIVTHKHSDHYKFFNTYSKQGYNCILSEPNTTYNLDYYKIIALPISHTIENNCLVISDYKNKRNYLYATDLTNLDYKFNNKFDIAMIEINYDTDTLASKFDKINNQRINNKIYGHLSFETFVFQKLYNLSDTFVIMHYTNDFLNKTLIENFLKQKNKNVIFSNN